MRIRFFFSEAFESLGRNFVMSVASVMTVLISMIILGIGVILFMHFGYMVDDVRDKMEIEVFIRNTATEEEVSDLGTRIEEMPEVQDVTYISKDRALEILREDLESKGKEDMLEALTGNPLPASYKIKLKNEEQIKEVASRFHDDPVVDNSPGKTDGVRYGEETADRILEITNIILIAAVAFVVLLTVASVLLISNTIRLSIFARRREIEIMRLVGATSWFIRWPFVIEGITAGIIGSTAAAAIVALLDNYVFDSIAENVSFVFNPAVTTPDVMLLIAVVIIAGGALVGALGSTMALRRFLRI